MKKVMLVFVIVFSILILLSVSTIFAEDPSEFINDCTDKGCYIYKEDGCGNSPADITYILGIKGYTDCDRTTTCNENNVVVTITSDSLPDPTKTRAARSRCLDEIMTSCVYTTPCETNYICQASTASCVVDVEINDVNFTDSEGVIIRTARINDSINMRTLGEKMKLAGVLTYEIFRDGNSIRTFTRDSDSETEDNYPWLAGFNGTNYTAGVYNFSVSVGGHEITSESLTIPLLSLSEVYFANATTGDKLAGARLNTMVNLTVIGTDLIGREIKYEILNEGVLVRTFLHTATSDTEDSVNWTLGEIGDDFFAGQYTFNASVSALGINRTSENALIIPELEDVYFADLRNNPISSTGLNSLVKLDVSGFFLDGEYITYEIWEVDGGFLWFDKELFTVSGDDVKTWRAGTDGDGTLIGGGTYYFIAKTDDDPDLTGDVISPITGNAVIKRKQSSDLVVSNIENNIPPVAKIKFPLDRQIYFVNSPITFEQGSFDLDDEFSYSWNLGDGTVKEGDSSTLENYDFDYTYLSPGQKNIELTITDDRGLSDTAKVSILVIASDYLLSYIESPAYNEEYGQIVEYDASGTYVISSEVAAEGCTKTITCLAGDCPAETKGVPTSESLGCDYDGDDEGIDVVGSLGPDLADYSEINFCWDFKEEVVVEGESITELCKDGDDGGLSFSITYPSSGRREVSLTASWGVEPAS